LAFHTKNSFGAVSCVVQRQLCLRYQVPVTQALTHEVVESGINPELNRMQNVWLPNPPGGYGVVMVEVADPVTGLPWTSNGVDFSNATGPRYWGIQDFGAFDLTGDVSGPLPFLAKDGAIEMPNGSLLYGDDINPNILAYLNERLGRRFVTRNPQT
jgi:hypothetical protein